MNEEGSVELTKKQENASVFQIDADTSIYFHIKVSSIADDGSEDVDALLATEDESTAGVSPQVDKPGLAHKCETITTPHEKDKIRADKKVFRKPVLKANKGALKRGDLKTRFELRTKEEYDVPCTAAKEISLWKKGSSRGKGRAYFVKPASTKNDSLAVIVFPDGTFSNTFEQVSMTKHMEQVKFKSGARYHMLFKLVSTKVVTPI